VDRSEREHLVAELAAGVAPGGPQPDFAELYMDAGGARELAGMGFEIGSHSAWHAILSRETPEAQAADLTGSRHELEALLDRPVTLLAYPNGTAADYSAATIAAARAAGYTNAVTTRVGLNTPQTPPFELRRFVVSPHRGTSAASWGGSLASRALRVARRKVRSLR
jgi:peptidoglycan/xylan/chitin deacetylase (PgdA/CDA1 family)